MTKLRMDKEKAATGVLECDTPEKLFKHFQLAFSIVDSPQTILDGVERIEIANGILSKPCLSALDLYAAQQACVLSGRDAQRAYEEIHPDSPVPATFDEVLPERLKAELISIGVETFNKCSELLINATSEHENVSHINSFIDKEIREKKQFIDKHVEEGKQTDESISLQNKMESICNEIQAISVVSGKYSSMPNDEYRAEYNRLYDERERIALRICWYNKKELRRIREEAANKFSVSIDALKLELDKALQRRDEADAALFEAVSSDLLSSSGVSEKQATEWVENNVFISDAGGKSLRRIGYSQAQFKRDVAEMYRYVGGKIGPIEFVVEGKSTRAFARGKSTIALQGNFTKRTLFHELSHLVEHLDPAFCVACKDFIKTRASGEATTLKALTGIDYPSTEIAYPDNFIDPYVGKIYASDSTEVVSMGLQGLSSPAALAELARRDPEHLKLALGICKRSNPLTHKQIEQSLEDTTEKITKRNRLELWYKELEAVCKGEFGQQLSYTSVFKAERGYRGYWLGAGGRSKTLYAVQKTNGNIELLPICIGSPKVMRWIAYLLIAHDAGILLQELSANEDLQQKIIRAISDGKIPDWFTEKTKLPKV